MLYIDIFIFRRDLRIYDNTALNSLLSRSNNIFPIFIFNPKQIYAINNSYYSNNSVQFMIESLNELDKDIDINYYEGDDIVILEKIKAIYNIKSVSFNKDYTPFSIKRDKNIKEWCDNNNIEIRIEEDYTLYPIGVIKNKENKPYQKFTSFYNNVLKYNVNKPKYINISKNKVNIIKNIQNFDKDKYYIHNNDIAVNGGRIEAMKRLHLNIDNYDKDRDYPYLDSTTKLSAYIKFGCISIREVYYNYKDNKSFIKELIWREFYANILYNYPYILGKSFMIKYNNVKWQNNKNLFKKWCEGETGYAIVDAGMKQLNKTGWMHNRVRMIVASFLVKDLLIDWRWGEKYFATKLVDYDPASNNGGWQWCSGTGTDAQPYFRIFNPILQSKRYDKNNEYIKKWNPDYERKKQIIDHKTQIKKFKNIMI